MVEIVNLGDEAVDLPGWVIDDINSLAQSAANIEGATLEAGEAAVLYNADDVQAADFAAAWGAGLTLVGVTGWDAMALNNGGDTVSLWSSFAAYDGDNEVHANGLDTVAYDDDGSVWPADDDSVSIYLTDLTADNADGAN